MFGVPFLSCVLSVPPSVPVSSLCVLVSPSMCFLSYLNSRVFSVFSFASPGMSICCSCVPMCFHFCWFVILYVLCLRFFMFLMFSFTLFVSSVLVSFSLVFASLLSHNKTTPLSPCIRFWVLTTLSSTQS